MSSPKERLKYITTAACIAAIYAALTYLGAFFGLSYGPIQIRFSEALTILPLFTPAASLQSFAVFAKASIIS